MNRQVGNKISKDKSRPSPKSLSEPGKQKSMEYVELITTCEDDVNISSTESFKDEYNDCVIDPHFLKSQQVPPTNVQKPRISVKVQKKIPSSKAEKAKPKEKVLVARSLPAKAKPLCKLAVTVPEGNIETMKPHSILGSIEEYKMQDTMKKGGEMLEITANEELVIPPHKKEVKNPVVDLKDDTVHIDEKNALKNWAKQMNERQRQQDHLSKSIAVSNELLLMNQSNEYRSIQEERMLIDRAMPSKDYGKGYRVGSEFWKQTETLGKDERVNITLSQTEKGNVPPIEHVGYPSSIKKEMGTDWKMTHRMKYTHYPWWKSEYLQERKQHLQNVIDELDPYNACLDELEIIGHSINIPASENLELGSNTDDILMEEEMEEDFSIIQKDPLGDYDNVRNLTFFGPSLLINDHSARWQDDYNLDNNGVLIRLLFASEIGSIGKKSIHIENDGTTVIHYLWEKLPEYNPFNVNKGRPLKRFFFNVSNGVILPGDHVDVPFIFKSPNAGIFTETWQLKTLPVLCGEERILITMRGIATECDVYENDRKLLEKSLQDKQNKVMAERILAGILASIKTPERPSTPVENYITEDEIFHNKNENLHFKMDSISKLKAFHNEFSPDTEWDLSLNSLLSNVINLDEEEKEIAFEKMNADIKELNYSILSPAANSKYDACYLILCDIFDKFSSKAQKLGQTFGLPEKELVIIKSNETITPSSKKLKKTDVEPTNKSKVEQKSTKKDTTLRNKTPKEKGKRDITGSGKLSEMENDVDNGMTEPPANSNYMEKLYVVAYNCLSEMANNLEAVLSN